MVEVHFLIPVADNAGIAFSPHDDEVFEDALLKMFGGFTGPFAPVGGGWRDASGMVYRDQNRAYMVFVSGLLSQSPQIIAAVNYAKSHYQQLAITVRYLDHAEIL